LTGACGEPLVRKYEEEAKVLLIKISEEELSGSTEDIRYILEHFAIAPRVLT
jgi:hypothetical protein